MEICLRINRNLRHTEQLKGAPAITVHLYSICWNEQPILEYFFRHYEPWVDVFHIFDDGSDDGTRDLLAARSDVVFEDFVRSDPDSFERSKNAHENGIWKQSRSIADWVLMVDMDEFVHHTDMLRYLKFQQGAGVSIIPALGYDMMLEAPATPGADLATCYSLSFPTVWTNKPVLFRPDLIDEINFKHGRHVAQPKGRVRYPRRDKVLLLHFEWFGVDSTIARYAELESVEARATARLASTSILTLRPRICVSARRNSWRDRRSSPHRPSPRSSRKTLVASAIAPEARAHPRPAHHRR